MPFLTCQDACLHGCSERHHLIGVDAHVGLLACELTDKGLRGREREGAKRGGEAEARQSSMSV